MDYLSTIAPVHIIKTIMLIGSLVIALIIVLYNWMYSVRMVSSFDETDLSPPKQIHLLVKASIFTALFTVLLIITLFVTRFY